MTIGMGRGGGGRGGGGGGEGRGGEGRGGERAKMDDLFFLSTNQGRNRDSSH